MISGFIILAFAIFGFTHAPNLLLGTLEDDFKVPLSLEKPHGIIVVGGGIAASGFGDSSDYHLFNAADRIIKGFALKQKYPNARLIYTGGSGELFGSDKPQSLSTRSLAQDLYAGSINLELETASRNTWENGVYTLDLISKADRKKTWLLVTSAWHMKRAMGVFSALGMCPTPYPTDYTAGETRFPYVTPYPIEQFSKLDIYLKEMIGINVYAAIGQFKNDCQES